MRSPRTAPMPASRHHRRGVTLLEMLVTVALLLLMMIIIVSVFQTATGAITVSRAYALLDQELRRLDSTIRLDLDGSTARMTPPRDPAENLGYFEYAENALSDAQGEDSDDTLRFTTTALPGQPPFVGRIWVPSTNPYTGVITLAPITTTSRSAEIIYFLRGTKLYRRVLLIMPSQSTYAGNYPMDPNIVPAVNPIGFAQRTGPTQFGFATNLFNPTAFFRVPYTSVTAGGGVRAFVGFLGMNDISAHPQVYPRGYNTSNAPNNPASIPESGYAPTPNTFGDLTKRENRAFSPRFADDYLNNANPSIAIPDGLPDDSNGDLVNDYCSTMHYSPGAGSDPKTFDSYNQNGAWSTAGYPVFSGTGGRTLTYDTAAFPYVYPNAFSPSNIASTAYGAIHILDPATTPNPINHTPLSDGDSLLPPVGLSTWWGFPTYRETMSPFWLDPIKRINDPSSATFFTDPIASQNETVNRQAAGLTAMSGPYYLPPQSFEDQPYNNQVPPPGPSDIFDIDRTATVNTGALPGEHVAPVFEDDLIADNVRSFDIKALDPNPLAFYSGALNVAPPGYYDLGYASQDFQTGVGTASLTSTYGDQLFSLGHEGRIPPVSADGRDDAAYPGFWSNGLGDDSTGVIRLRRTWDTWSTSYTRAGALNVNPIYGPNNPSATNPPPVPSYPAPYPVPLRGIQIQIRITDSDEKYVKVLTIRQDFSNKL